MLCFIENYDATASAVDSGLYGLTVAKRSGKICSVCMYFVKRAFGSGLEHS